jgi:NAD(P)-dependent dehydrogenase (short-subunit alcohol dehydrogenase family)
MIQRFADRNPVPGCSASMPLPSTENTATVDLSGRAILVTGASGGLGRALSLACARHGATVILHGRVVRKLEALYDEIVAAGHPQPTILPLDLALASADDFGNLAGAIRSQLGRLDGLVHTAAFLGSLGPIEHQSFDAWQKVLRVNLASAMALTRSALPLLSAAPDACVLFTLDARGENPRAYWGAYAAAKSGLSTLATILADEWENRPNLRVNAVVPGPMRSPLRALTHPGEDRSALPLPDTLVPLYLHLLGAQTKAESGMLIDAQAWRAGHAASSPLAAAAAASRP